MAAILMILILLFIAERGLNETVKCPVEDTLLFCECHTETIGKHNAQVICNSVPSSEDLRTSAKLLNHIVIDHFYVANSNLGYVESTTFHGTHIKRLEFSKTPLSNLTEHDQDAFLGLGFVLEELVIRYCDLTKDVDLTKIRNLHALHSLDLSFNPLNEISDQTFVSPPRQLKQLYLKGCGLKYISLNAFAAISKLLLLDLSENQIRQVVRSMFPQPASYIQYLYFSYNQIKEFPQGIFSDMPELRTVYAANNGLHYLPHGVWNDLWSNSPRTVDLLGNDIHCDKHLCWLTLTEANFLRGSCSEPDSLRGRRFRTLWPWEVNCNGTVYNGNLSLPVKSSF